MSVECVLGKQMRGRRGRGYSASVECLISISRFRYIASRAKR